MENREIKIDSKGRRYFEYPGEKLFKGRMIKRIICEKNDDGFYEYEGFGEFRCTVCSEYLKIV